VSEINCLSKLNHQNIVKYIEEIVIREQKKIYIVMEFCENGDMAQLIKKCKSEKDFVAEDVIWKIFMQILLALRECHYRGIKGSKILHRDLKPSNIFFDASNNVKLGDFGLSRIIKGDAEESNQFANTNVGTPYYMSPEQVHENQYDEKTDIWSTGCVIYELVSLLPPFTAKNHLALAEKIIAGKIERIPERYSEDLQEVIQAMLQVDPKARPTVEDLIKIPKIKLRINERKMRDQYAKLKYKEQKL
jgi:serine/threonine protein kinase